MREVLETATRMTGPEVRTFHGFGGLHGGLVTARLLRSAATEVPANYVPVEISAHLVRRATEVPVATSTVLHLGRSGALTSSYAETEDGTVALAQTVFRVGSPDPPPLTVAPPAPPNTAGPAHHDRFVVPVELVPISAFMEIRPATPNLPYTGAAVPELSSWIRLIEPIDDPLQRLCILADALAPSYAAVLNDWASIPTSRMTIRFTPAALSTDFDWVHIRSVTAEAQADRWLTEKIDLWAAGGDLLASASQLRIVRDRP
jgi:acyl-CoA thioesterase